MSKLFEMVHAILARGPRSKEEVVTECRRAGLTCRPETLELFLQLSREVAESDGVWSRKGGSKQDRIITALQKAFSSSQSYVSIDSLSRFLDESEPLTVEDIAAACKNTGVFRLEGKLILRAI